jgi:hypothetical protein
MRKDDARSRLYREATIIANRQTVDVIELSGRYLDRLGRIEAGQELLALAAKMRYQTGSEGGDDGAPTAKADQPSPPQTQG